MSMIRWKPLSDIDKFFEEFKETMAHNELESDVYEKNGNVVIQVNAPGIKPEDIDLTIENDYVRISASRKEEVKKEEKDYFVREIKKGNFERIIDLPVPVNSEQAKAEFKNGTLTVTVPKLNKKEGHKIKIESGQS